MSVGIGGDISYSNNWWKAFHLARQTRLMRPKNTGMNVQVTQVVINKTISFDSPLLTQKHMDLSLNQIEKPENENEWFARLC